MNAKTIGEAMDHIVLPGPKEWREAARSCIAAINALKEPYRELAVLCRHLFEFARLAYDACEGWNPELAKDPQSEERLRLRLAAQFAGQYMAVFRHTSWAFFGGNAAAAVERLQRVSAWLRRNGGNGIPQFVMDSPKTSKLLYKSAEQMHRDMDEFRRNALPSGADGDAGTRAA